MSNLTEAKSDALFKARKTLRKENAWGKLALSSDWSGYALIYKNGDANYEQAIFVLDLQKEPFNRQIRVSAEGIVGYFLTRKWDDYDSEMSDEYFPKDVAQIQVDPSTMKPIAFLKCEAVGDALVTIKMSIHGEILQKETSCAPYQMPQDVRAVISKNAIEGCSGYSFANNELRLLVNVNEVARGAKSADFIRVSNFLSEIEVDAFLAYYDVILKTGQDFAPCGKACDDSKPSFRLIKKHPKRLKAVISRIERTFGKDDVINGDDYWVNDTVANIMPPGALIMPHVDKADSTPVEGVSPTDIVDDGYNVTRFIVKLSRDSEACPLIVNGEKIHLKSGELFVFTPSETVHSVEENFTEENSILLIMTLIEEKPANFVRDYYNEQI